jgi:hypothetical protein
MMNYSSRDDFDTISVTSNITNMMSYNMTGASSVVSYNASGRLGSVSGGSSVANYDNSDKKGGDSPLEKHFHTTTTTTTDNNNITISRDAPTSS